MAFWATGFWTDGFWADGFWQEAVNYTFSVSPGAASIAGQAIGISAARKMEALFGAEIVSGTDAGLKRFAKLLLDTGAFNFTGTDDVTFLKARGVWVQTVFSHAAGRNTVSAEKVRRATAQPRITGV